MKRLQKRLSAVVIACATVVPNVFYPVETTYAYDLTTSGLKYEIENDECKIVGYIGMRKMLLFLLRLKG